MTRKELVEKLMAVGNDDSEIKELFDSSDICEVSDVVLGRPNPEFESEEADEDTPELVDEDIIFIRTGAIF